MRFCVMVLALLGVVGCGSIKVRDVNESEVMKVRRVALASFSFEQPGEPDPVVHESPFVNSALEDLASALRKNMHWTVISPEEMSRNSTYKEVYASKMKGWQTGKVPPPGKLFLVPGVMDAQSVRRLSPAERDRLMDSLKVDALIEAGVNVVFAGQNAMVMGFGARRPQAYVRFWMYKRGVAPPVWFDGRVVGDAAAESVGATKFYDETKVTELGRLSAKGVFQNLNLKVQQ